jgi:HK97 family phage major capsid protein
MAFNNIISRSDVAGLVPVEYSNELARGAVETSNVLRVARRLRDMNHKERILPVLSALASAYFVSGDTELVETSEVNWRNVTITAEDLAVIVPVPKNVLDDSSLPIWSEVMPSITEAVGRSEYSSLCVGSTP